jgi:two-component system, OmpR family, KDP operon response regulator KdpE
LTDNTLEKKKCVLVVDDNLKVLRFIEINLKLCGYEVIMATTGDEALNIIKSAIPDIVLLDMVMPGMDGFEVLERLRVFAQLPVIACSASPANYHEAIRRGASDFLPKPFQPDELVRRIKVFLNQ